MLELRDVSHLLRWQLAPTPEIQTTAEKYVRRFTRPDSFGMYCAGLSAMAQLTRSKYYSQMATAAFEAGIARGVPIGTMMPWHVPPEENGHKNHVYTIDEASELSAKYRLRGMRVGFLHGHFRAITPVNWLHVLVAREMCDVLFLGRERNWRTKLYKDAEPIVDDWDLEHMILASGFDGVLVSIARTQYSDQGYASILKKINPTIYFGQFGIPPELQSAMANRAQTIGAILILLREELGASTTRLIKEGQLTVLK